MNKFYLLIDEYKCHNMYPNLSLTFNANNFNKTMPIIPHTEPMAIMSHGFCLKIKSKSTFDATKAKLLTTTSTTI